MRLGFFRGHQLEATMHRGRINIIDDVQWGRFPWAHHARVRLCESFLARKGIAVPKRARPDLGRLPGREQLAAFWAERGVTREWARLWTLFIGFKGIDLEFAK